MPTRTTCSRSTCSTLVFPQAQQYRDNHIVVCCSHVRGGVLVGADQGAVFYGSLELAVCLEDRFSVSHQQQTMALC